MVGLLAIHWTLTYSMPLPVNLLHQTLFQGQMKWGSVLFWLRPAKSCNGQTRQCQIPSCIILSPTKQPCPSGQSVSILLCHGFPGASLRWYQKRGLRPAAHSVWPIPAKLLCTLPANPLPNLMVMSHQSSQSHNPWLTIRYKHTLAITNSADNWIYIQWFTEIIIVWWEDSLQLLNLWYIHIMDISVPMRFSDMWLIVLWHSIRHSELAFVSLDALFGIL